MPQFTYTAVNSAGKKQSGSMEAANRSQLVGKLRDDGWFVIQAEDVADAVQRKEISGSKKINLKILAIFARQFSTLINSGITVVKALDILYQQIDDKNLRKSIGKIYEAVQKGETMSEAFRHQGDAYPELFINMLATGENAGNLDTVLMRMADHYEKENKLKNKIKGAMIYPAVLGILTVVVVILMLVVVLPSFVGIITSGGGKIPLPTKILLDLSDFLQSYWYLVFGGILLFVIGFRGFRRSDKGGLLWDSFKLKVPIVKKSLPMIYASRFSRTLSTLLSSGIQMIQAIEITARVINNRKIKDQLMTVTEDIRKGSQLSTALSRIEVFPVMIQNMISVGEESGMLDDILEKTANFYDEESDAAISRLVGLLEPLMIIFMAVIIGFIVIAIALPMFSMYGEIA